MMAATLIHSCQELCTGPYHRERKARSRQCSARFRHLPRWVMQTFTELTSRALPRVQWPIAEGHPGRTCTQARQQCRGFTDFPRVMSGLQFPKTLAFLKSAVEPCAKSQAPTALLQWPKRKSSGRSIPNHSPGTHAVPSHNHPKRRAPIAL